VVVDGEVLEGVHRHEDGSHVCVDLEGGSGSDSGSGSGRVGEGVGVESGGSADANVYGRARLAYKHYKLYKPDNGGGSVVRVPHLITQVALADMVQDGAFRQFLQVYEVLHVHLQVTATLLQLREFLFVHFHFFAT
jgi:hypothetical protein